MGFFFLLEFPSKPFHIHFKQYKTTALFEWEAVTPDLDMTYEIVLKNYTGDDIVSTIPGSNAKIYEYLLNNLAMNTDKIVQLCTMNAVGKNCSSTFKLKMDDPNILLGMLNLACVHFSGINSFYIMFIKSNDGEKPKRSYFFISQYEILHEINKKKTTYKSSGEKH
jgi:hypothetical protein